MKRFGRILILLFFCWQTQAQQLSIKSYGPEDGIGDGYVYALAQDRSGFIWMSTTKGLFRFDGQFFQPFLSDSMGDDFVTSLCVGSNDEILAGTFKGRLLQVDTKTGRSARKANGINGSLTSMHCTKDAATLIVYSKGNGLKLLQSDRFIQVPNSENYEINDFELLEYGEMVVATSEGLLCFRKGAVENWILEDCEVNAVQMVTDHEYFISVTGSGIRRLIVDDSMHVRENELVMPLQKENKQYVSFLFDASSHAIYATATDERLYVNQPGNGKVIQVSESEFMGRVSQFLIDNEGQVWAGTTGKGLKRILSMPAGFTEIPGGVSAITSWQGDQRAFGTVDGIILQNDADVRIKQIGGKSIGKVTALLTDDEDRLWIGTENSGLFVIDQSYRPIPVTFSTNKEVRINSINRGSKANQVVVCTNLEGVFIYDGIKLNRQFSVKNSLLHNNVFSAASPGNDAIYYATHHSSFTFSKKNHIYEVNLAATGLTSDFNVLSAGRDGKLYIGTNGNGIYVLQDTTVEELERNGELSNAYCYGLLAAGDTDLYIGLRYSLYQYKLKHHQVKKLDLPVSQQLIQNNAIFLDDHRVLWTGTSNGVISFSLAAERPARQPLPYLLSVRIGDSLYDYQQAIELDAGEHELTIGFSALSLKSSEAVKFQYMLSGRDNAWSEPSNKKKVTYAHLSEGTYTFSVRAINCDGVLSANNAQVIITVLPPFWKRPLFWVGTLVLVLSFFYLFMRIRTASLIRRQKELETMVEEKTSQLREEKKLVEEKNRIIGEQHQDITDSITYAKRIQDALLPEKGDIPSSVFVLYQPRNIVSGDFYWIADSGDRRVIVAADCTGHGVPGAFMSMIGNTLLNRVVIERCVTHPDQILRQMDTGIRELLRQHSPDSPRDGMDMAVVTIGLSDGKVQYAGAQRMLVQVRNNQVIEYTPDKSGLGGYHGADGKTFKTLDIPVEKGDMLYIFSDGYADQFGGPRGKKLMLKHLKNSLGEIASMELVRQEDELRSRYNHWKGTLEQVDDVLVIGILIT